MIYENYRYTGKIERNGNILIGTLECFVNEGENGHSV